MIQLSQINNEKIETVTTPYTFNSIIVAKTLYSKQAELF